MKDSHTHPCQPARRNLCRNRRGAIMATAELMISVPLFVAASLFMIDLSTLGFSHEKFANVLMQSANYAVNLAPDQDPSKLTPQAVKELCAQNNLNVTNLKVVVVKTEVAGCEAITVKATANVPLVAGSALPSVAGMQDAATALVPANRVCAAIAINPFPYSAQNPGGGASVYIPIVAPRNGVPVWQFPCDQALNNLHIVQGETPSAPPAPKDLYFAERPSLY